MSTTWPPRALLGLAPLLASGVVACEPAPPAEPIPLVEHGRWRPVSVDEDPFGDEPEAERAPCDDASFRVEPPVLEVSTAACAHVTLSQPALARLRAGDLVHVVAWHVALTAPSPAEGHMALALGERVVWEYRVDIPAGEQILKPYVALEEEVAEGTPVRLHVHNHGDNEWKLLEITAGPREVYEDAPAK